MSLLRRFVPVFLVCGLTLAGSGLTAATDLSAQRIEASYLLGLGRAPTASESAEAHRANSSADITTLLARHRQDLAADTSARSAVNTKARVDALGTREGSKSTTGTYAELMAAHLEQLQNDADAYEDVIRRAYWLVINRDAYDEELAYWRNHPDTLPFALLVGCIEDWARRNQPGLMVTAGKPTISINCEFLGTVRLSPTVAAEARAAIGLSPAGDDAHHLIAPGGAHIATGGRMHFAAVGSADLLP